MVTATNNSTTTTTNFTLPSPSAATTSGAGGAADPFAQELAQMIEGYLSQNSSGSSSTKLDVSITQSQGQLTVSVTQEDPSSTSSTTSSSTSAGGVGSSLMNAVAVTGSSTPTSTTTGTTSTTSGTIDKSNMTPDDAYWAEQPAPVQALRNMTEPDRSATALQLAQQGYAIDVPIMVWNWDPLTTMIERQNYGYTWVPSALQSPVALAPGLSYPGLTPYDPNSPPPGSIQVTTDFAKGTNMQDMFIDPATIEASWTNAASSNTSSTQTTTA